MREREAVVGAPRKNRRRRGFFGALGGKNGQREIGVFTKWGEIQACGGQEKASRERGDLGLVQLFQGRNDRELPTNMKNVLNNLSMRENVSASNVLLQVIGSKLLIQ